MTNTISLSAEQTNLDNLLSKRAVLKVPPFQRTYSWKREQFEELWNDIKNGIQQDWDHHLDQITIVPDETKVPTEQQVIDGQQRLTTLSVLLCAMRDVYERRQGQESRQTRVTSGLLETQDLDGNPVRQLQLLSETGDDKSYQAVFEGRPSDADGQIGEAYSFFAAKLRKLSTEQVTEIRKYVQSRLTFIRTEVGELVHAYVMFETTNSRGMDLQPLEMAKAILMRIAHRSQADEETVRRLWLSVLETARGVDSGKPPRPIKDVLAVSDTFSAPVELSGRQFVGHIRSLFNDSDRIERDLRQIDDQLSEYQKIVTASVSRFSKRQNAKINSLIRQFNQKNSHAGILLHWLFDNYENADRLIAILDLAVILRARLILADRTAYKKRDAVHAVYKQLSNGVEAERAIKDTIAEHTPTDESLRIEIQQRTFRKNASTRQILYRVEADHFGGPAVSDTGYPSPGEDFEIEHIAPEQSFSADKYTAWRRVLDHEREQFKKHRKRLGNLTLLREPQNIQAGTEPFSEKSQVYRDSDFGMAKAVTEYDGWGFKQIQQRTERMATLVVDSFSVSTDATTTGVTDGAGSLNSWLSTGGDD
jgi:uncharacterized protein with ParB-like and HNH nuclease domain